MSSVAITRVDEGRLWFAVVNYFVDLSSSTN